jgi:hypothetical protein
MGPYIWAFFNSKATQRAYIAFQSNSHKLKSDTEVLHNPLKIAPMYSKGGHQASPVRNIPLTFHKQWQHSVGMDRTLEG